jgi:hypothetical protein
MGAARAAHILVQSFGAFRAESYRFTFCCAECLELWRTAADVGPVAQVVEVVEGVAQLGDGRLVAGQPEAL